MLRADTRMSVAHDPAHRKRQSADIPLNFAVRIALLGSSASENSLVGNFILGRAVFDSEAPPDVVERVTGRLKDRHVIVINSPQLLQKNISDHQITQTVRECVNLSDPGPHVIVLLLRHEQCSADDQECVEKVLLSFSEQVYQHTMVITTQELTETNDVLQKIIQKCANRHYSLQRSSSPDDLLQALEHIEKINDGRHLVCEGSQNISVNQQATGRFSEGVKLNLVVCGSDETLKNSISELLQQQTDVELRGCLINVVKLPALIRLSEEEVTLQTLRCVSLCHPGVHVFLLIVPIGPLTDGDKAEMEKIQRTFSSRINQHILILIKSTEHQTAELSEETQAAIKSFGGQHHVFGPKTQVSTLMKSIDQILKKNNDGFFFSTETIWEAQIKKFEEILKRFHSLQISTQCEGLTESRDALRIVLLGKTGVGKSASGNTILGRDVFKAETSHKSITKELKRETSEINGRHITVIDTPGLFDTELTNEEFKREISNCISMILPGPHVFIIVLNLGQRFTQEEAASVKIIQEIFGENSLMYTMVLFTRGDDLKNKTIEQFLGKPGSPLMKLIEACGNRYHVFNNNQTEDRTQVSDLLEKIDKMVKKNGGSFYSCKMFREMETEKQEQHVKILMEKVREKEEETKKLEEENERMKMIMSEEKRKNHEKNTKRRDKQDDKRSEKEKQTCSDTYDKLQVVYRKLETEHSMWSWSLRKAMMEIENKLHNKIENYEIKDVKETDLHKELEEKKEEVGKLMSDFFEKDTDAVILFQWKTSFENKIKELQGNILRETKRKLNEILQQREIKKNVDAQKTHHDNTLYEKSKELALKHKDKTNEKTLKKEFDSFWKQIIEDIQSDQKNPIGDIDIMRDVKKLNGNVYKIVSVNHWRESKNIFIVSSYSDYVKLKKFSEITKSVKDAIRNSKGMFGYGITEKDEAQIKSLVTDIVQQTDTMIQSFNISKMGYKISCFQQLTGYIKATIKEHQEGPVKYKFKKTFFMDLVYSICKRANKMVTDQHRLFREANDPAIYVKKKREEYYSIFQKCCQGSASAVIFGEIICQKLKEPIEQSIYKNTARDLTGEMRANCESLNGNRANLEKHILKRLAEEEDFEKYMNYIHNPRDHFKSFIRDEVNQYIIHKFSVSVLPKMKENIELLQQKIIKAAQESTEHVQENRGDLSLWLKSFTQKLSDELIFSEKDLSGVKHDDVNDFKLLEDVIRKECPAIMSEIGQRFNRKTFSVNLDYKDRPHQFLIDHFCQCCWVQCPFCKATCTNTIENHDEDHSVSFHRVDGINGTYHSGTQNLSADVCTNLVGTDQDFNTPEGQFKYKEYSTAGGVYADWSITPDTSELPYWKWFVCRFQKDLEKCYRKTFERNGKIPDKWKKYKKQDAIESLDQYI